MKVKVVCMHTVVCTVQGRFVCCATFFCFCGFFFKESVIASLQPVRATTLMLMYEIKVKKEKEKKQIGRN